MDLRDNQNRLHESEAQNDDCNLITFESLYKENRDKVYKRAYSFIQCQHFADDITQEVFMKLWKCRERFGTIQNLTHYIIAATTNTCLNVMARNRRFDMYLQGITNDAVGNNVEENIYSKEYVRILAREVSKLPERRRLVFRLIVETGWHCGKVAKALNISPKTAKNHKALAFKVVMSSISNKIQICHKNSISLPEHVN
ncbi:MAG: sigma-70 family RNA polymerase sigma factor [Chitinophagaceae bacterium]